MAWHKYYHLGNSSSWSLTEHTQDSWHWKSLLNLRPLARPFITCTVQNGNMASFWFDQWTPLGLLLDILGVNGPKLCEFLYMLLSRKPPEQVCGICHHLDQMKRCHFTLIWVAVQDRFPTRTRLASWGMLIPTSCCLCSASDESRDHFFVDCPYTQIL